MRVQGFLLAEAAQNTVSANVSVSLYRWHFNFFAAFLIKGIINDFFQNNQVCLCMVRDFGGSLPTAPSKPLRKCDCGRVICVPGIIIRFVANEGPTAQIY